ncbi:hypothetical protein [Endozoicomonas sp. Mp262]|uniref:hypothetical protein n=1 Tax=Endozoicomonas sp. Mp262 TaxID=2919499 RepID=UPI0021DB35BB
MDRMPPINPGYGKDLNGLSDAEANGNSEESSSVKPVNIENEIPKVEADFFSEMDKKGVKRPVETVDPSLSVSDKKTRLDGGLSETGDLVLNESQEIQDLASLKHDLKSREELLDLYAELKSSQNDRKCRKVKRKILGKQGEFYLESILGCILVKQFEKRNISIKDVNEK